MSFKIEKSVIATKDAFKVYSTKKDTYFYVVPEMGANILRYVFDGTPIINCDEKAAAAGGFTGMPVLFPTPNRVKDCKTTYCGTEYTQMKNGKPHLLHGYAFDTPFNVEETVEGADCAFITLSMEMKDGDEVLKSYPFPNKLSITYTLYADRLKVSYKIENHSDNEMPYGFAVHPYFFYKDDAVFSIPSDTYVETTPEVIPTRNFLPTEGKFPGINKGLRASSVVLDNNYIKRDGENATLFFTDEKVKITFNAPDYFKHFVVYHPYGAHFICIENQTCSIDANNLFLEGFKKESNQKFIAPHGTDGGELEFTVERTQM